MIVIVLIFSINLCSSLFFPTETAMVLAAALKIYVAALLTVC